MNKIHLIGNAHLDPVWLWQWQEGFAEIKATFRSALDRIREFPDFKFTAACGAYYMWIEKSDPQMFEEIRQRVHEGRWCIVGGWFIQPDCNIPSGESFARHSLITQRYFLEKFGKTATTGYNVDSFGHNGSIPMILHNSRMENYVFMRPADHEKSIPTRLFLWESNDGSRVKAYRIPFYYNLCERKPMSLFDDIADIAEREDVDQMAFYGIGNHGGGPTVKLLEAMHRELDERFIYSDPDTYFADQAADGLFVLKDDLQYHAKGCYSACAEIKKNNRYAENGLIAAERLSVLSERLTSTEYPAKEIRYAWQRVLFNQFHDIIGGCSIYEAYDDARKVHGEAMAIADRVSNFARQQISWNIDTCGDHLLDTAWTIEEAERVGVPIVVFNPLDHEVRMPVHLRKTYECIRDSKGNEVPIQTVRDSKTNHKGKYARIFEAVVPALGYTVYRGHNEEGTSAESPFVSTDSSVENSRLKLTFDAESGELCSIYDKLTNRELLGDATETRLYNDEPNDTWAHGVEFFKDAVHAEVKGSVNVTELGPVRATVRTVQTISDSTIIRDYRIYPDADYIDVEVLIDYRERFKILKLLFPTNTEGGKAYCKIPFGSIERPTDGSEQVCGDWIALVDDRGGLAVANDCKHSFDAENGVLSLTVLRSAIFADHYGQGLRDNFCRHMDQGEHSFKYRIMPFESIGRIERRAEELQHPLEAVIETFHKGDLPMTFCGMHLDTDNLSVTAVKKSEDGDGVVVRLYETDGLDTDTELELFGVRVKCHVSHNTVKTYLIKDGAAVEVDFLE
ncbi:MAG: alpha-mannosidase [Clostridia bacterium]|nr:alpha-mannosidase [Clostridia bacterium]